MTAEKLINAILNKCDIYFGRALISKEAIIEKYLSFFSNSLVSKERSVNFALHSGSVCFDVISVVAVALGCISYNMTSNDDVISGLKVDDMVMFKSQRYRWKGTTLDNGILRMLLEQDGKGRNGKTVSSLPLEKNKHLLKPYYGDSKVTDGRGVRKNKSNREDFLSYAFEVPIAEVPTQIDVSIAIVAGKTIFNEIYKQVTISYNSKSVYLSDIVPASYFTSGGEEHQCGQNPTKTEAVLKVTSKLSMARELVLDRQSNKVVGLLVLGGVSLVDNDSELEDLLRRKTLRFVHVTSPIKAGMSEYILDRYENASVFACTKEYLRNNAKAIKVSNSYTRELNRQIKNITNSKVIENVLDNGWTWKVFRSLKNNLFLIRNSNWQDEEKDEFLKYAYGLINLFNSAVFTMDEMETAIAKEQINRFVVSPEKRLEKLLELAELAGSMQEKCVSVITELDTMYRKLRNDTPKTKALEEYVHAYVGKRIAIVLPKAYYSEMLHITHPEYFKQCEIIASTANRFDPKQEYDGILVISELNNSKFDPLQCVSAQEITVFLYECEQKLFSHRKKKLREYERKLNVKIGARKSVANEETVEQEDEYVSEEDIRTFSSLDEYITDLSSFDVRSFAQSNHSSEGTSFTAEVKYVGVFVSGEQILFSRNYSAVTYDSEKGEVVEKKPEKLQSGDVLVFVKRDDYTRNIVDYIYESLLSNGKLSADAINSFEKSCYWKEVLREYKEKYELSYYKLAKKLSSAGSAVTSATVRHWVMDDSFVIGPQNEAMLMQIATITKDPYLLADAHGYFEACRSVRQDRRKILNYIGKAINDKLRGNIPAPGSDFEIVYNNVENLSETLELEFISELEHPLEISSNLVNAPITETEVLM